MTLEAVPRRHPGAPQHTQDSHNIIPLALLDGRSGARARPRPLTLELQLLTDRGAGGTTDLRQCTQGELNPATRAPCTTTKLTLEVSTIIESRAYAARANTRPVYSQVVSATPPSIAIEALVLGGPESVRVKFKFKLLHKQQTT